MESHNEYLNAWDSMQWQLNEGVDECIRTEAIIRFESVSHPPQARPPSPIMPSDKKAEPANTLPDFSAANDPDDISLMLMNALSALTQKGTKLYQSPILEGAVDLLIYTDQPSANVVETQDFLADPNWNFFEITLNTIGMTLDLSRKDMRHALILPLFPWVLNFSKFPDSQELGMAMKAYFLRLAYYQPKAIAFTGSHYLTGKSLFDQALEERHGQTSWELVAPQAMLKNYILKRRHWQGLQNIHENISV